MLKKQPFFILIALLPIFSFAQKNYSTLLHQYMQSYATGHDFSGAVLVGKKKK